MGKHGSHLGGLKNAGAWPGWGSRRRCIGCKRHIVYGERCPDCYRVLRARKRRKRR